MRGLKKGFAAGLVVALLVVGGAGNAGATSYLPTYTSNPNWVSVAPYDSMNPAGAFVTPLAFDSTRSIGLYANYIDAGSWRFGPEGAQFVAAQPLFTNQHLPAEFGQSKWVENLSLAGYRMEAPSPSAPGMYFITPLFWGGDTVKKLINPWTLNNSLTLPVGTLIMGCFDNGQFANPYEFIVAVSDTAPTHSSPTPIPGAVWLLGSGLVGLAGFKRARKRT